MEIDGLIFLNQVAQGIVEPYEAERWFNELIEMEMRLALQQMSFMIANSSPTEEDVPAAISRSGLKSTMVPCVVLQSGKVRVQIGKLSSLPQKDLTKSFRLLLALLCLADDRRREREPLDPANFWWHRDLSNPEVVAAIKAEVGP